jgi:hypothetical protein
MAERTIHDSEGNAYTVIGRDPDEYYRAIVEGKDGRRYEVVRGGTECDGCGAKVWRGEVCGCAWPMNGKLVGRETSLSYRFIEQ